MKAMFIILGIFFPASCMASEDVVMNLSKRRAEGAVAHEEIETRDVRRRVELSLELVEQLRALVEQNNFQKYFEIIDGLDEDARKEAYEIEFKRGTDTGTFKVMYSAALKNNTEALKELYRRGVSVNSTRSPDNSTPLHVAAT